LISFIVDVFVACDAEYGVVFDDGSVFFKKIIARFIRVSFVQINDFFTQNAF
jgi:hypothetical protein